MNEKPAQASLSPTDKFRGSFNALFRYPIRLDEAEEWEVQVLQKFGHAAATDAIRRLSERGIDHSPTIQEVRREVIAFLPKRSDDDAPRIRCAYCHADGGLMTFGVVSRSEDYPEVRNPAICGFSGWCPGRKGIEPKEGEITLPAESCAILAEQGLVCGKCAVYCACTSGERKLQAAIAKGMIKDIAGYEAIRKKVFEAIRRRINWENSNQTRPETTRAVEVDVSMATGVAREMLKKFV